MVDKDGNEGVLVNGKGVLSNSNDMLGSDWILVMAGEAETVMQQGYKR